jgi:predicted TIM-barrel enzyme
VENLGDVPFAKRAPTDTIAITTMIVEGIMRKARIPIGANVLREGK